MHLRKTYRKTFNENPRTYFPPNPKKISNFLQMLFSLIIPLDPLIWSLQVPILLSQRQKIVKFFSEYLFPKCSSKHVLCSFDNHAKSISVRLSKTSPQLTKKLYNVSKKIIPSCCSGHVESSFDNYAGIFSNRVEKIFLKLWKILSKFFLCIRKMHFWQTCL